jgi:flavodoxin
VTTGAVQPVSSRGSLGPSSFVLLLAAFVLAAVCGGASAQSRADGAGWSGRRVLVVYLTRTNNTKAVAQIIHDVVGGTLVGLELETPYPADYQATVQQVASENETGFLPPLKTRIDRIEDYDVVFVGFPTWGMQLPPPMKSFLRQYDLRGKTVIPFNTNAGYGIGTSFQTVAQLCPQSTVLEGLAIRGGIERDGELFAMDGARLASARIAVAGWLSTLDALIAARSGRGRG